MEDLFAADKWSFASDRKLFDMLHTFSTEQMQRCERVLNTMQALDDRICNLQRDCQSITSELNEIKGVRYLQVDVSTGPLPANYERKPNVALTPSQQQEEQQQVRHLEEFDIDPLNERPLPFIIGSEDFMQSNTVGLAEGEDVEEEITRHMMMETASQATIHTGDDEEEDLLFTFSPSVPVVAPSPHQPSISRQSSAQVIQAPVSRQASLSSRQPPPPPPPSAAIFVSPLKPIIAPTPPPPPKRPEHTVTVTTTTEDLFGDAVVPFGEPPPPPVVEEEEPKATLRQAIATAIAASVTPKPVATPIKPKTVNSKPLFDDDLFNFHKVTPPPPQKAKPTIERGKSHSSRLFEDDEEEEEDEGFIY